MTNQTTCPHCGAEGDSSFGNAVHYKCGSTSGFIWRQSVICEIDELKSKVAVQQELLKEAATSLRDILQIVEQSPTSQGQFWEFCRKTQFAQEVLKKLEQAK